MDYTSPGKSSKSVEMKYAVLILLVFSFLRCQQFDKEKNVIYLVGDSTMSEKLPEKRPETGWGEMLGQFFVDGMQIENHAKNGRSTRTFIEEGRWKNVITKLRKNDYVFIQFGHNDAKQNSERYASPEQYRKNLLKFTREVRAKKAVPILLTPVVRRRFDEQGKFYDTHGSYPEHVRQLAKKEKVTLLDLHQLSMKLFEELGKEGTKPLFLILEKGAHPNYPEGLDDNTHFSPKGAMKIAELVRDEIQKSGLDVKKYLVHK